MYGECRYSIHGAYGIWIPSHFYKMFEGIDHHDTLPQKKTPLKIDGWKTILFLVGGRLFVRGKLAVFKEWRFENSLHLTGKYTWSPKKPSNPLPRSLIGRLLEMKLFGESFWQENVPIVLQVYGFDFWPREILLTVVSNLVKKEWYEVPVNWYRISTINSINKKNCSKVRALSETLATNATSVLTCSNGHF